MNENKFISLFEYKSLTSTGIERLFEECLKGDILNIRDNIPSNQIRIFPNMENKPYRIVFHYGGNWRVFERDSLYQTRMLVQQGVDSGIESMIERLDKPSKAICLKCGHELIQIEKYCPNCGYNFNESVKVKEPTEEERLISAINEAVEINEKINAEKKLKRQELYNLIFKLKNYNFPEISFSFLDRIKLRSNIYSILLCETCIHIEYSIEHHIINIDYNTAYNETTLKNLEKRLNNEDNEIIDQLVSVLPKFKILCLRKIYRAISGKKWNQPNGFNELMDFIGE